MLSVLLPILAFFSLWVFSGNTRREPNWRTAFIQAMILWGTYTILLIEVLSFFEAINRTTLSLGWGLLLLTFAIWLALWIKRRAVLRLPLVYRGLTPSVTLLDVLLTLIVIIPLLIGFIAPPNSQEAMSFGMTRVAIWEQNQSLAHIATANEGLNSAPPGMGIQLLNFYVLSGSDRWSNFVAWLAFLGSIEAAMAIAGLFGASPKGTRLAAIFGATLPIALALASGSLDDLPSCLWVMAFVLMAFYYKKDKNYTFNLILAILAFSLAFITKPVSLIFLVPFVVYLLILRLRHVKIWRTLAGILIAVLIFGTLSAGFLYRNFQTYGTGYELQAYYDDLNGLINWRTVISNASRNIALHADIPIPGANAWIMRNLENLHCALNLDINDPRTTSGGSFSVTPFNTSEMTSGNPIQGLIIILIIFFMFGMFFHKPHRELFLYTGLLMVSILIYITLLRWRPDGSRWHLAFFFMFAPLAGFLLEYLNGKRKTLGTLVALVLIVSSLPWLFSVSERPIIPIKDITYPHSIFSSNRQDLYFATAPQLGPVFEQSAEIIKNSWVTEVGLQLDAESLSYPLWSLTRGSENKILFRELGVTGPSAKYADTSFSPELVFSQYCSESEEIFNYEKLVEGSGYCLLKRLP